MKKKQLSKTCPPSKACPPSKTCPPPSSAKEILRGFFKAVDDIARDRPKYVAQFFDSWEGSVRDLEALAACARENPSFDLPTAYWQNAIAPYNMFHHFYFNNLMDHLELDEEERLLAAAEHLTQAWQHFFAAVLTHHAKAKELVERLQAAQIIAQEESVPLYTGEHESVLKPRWAHAFTELEEGYAAIAAVLSKEEA